MNVSVNGRRKNKIMYHPYKQPLIVCPACGAEYTLAEIYVDFEDIAGHSTGVRDYRGKIVELKGQLTNTCQVYQCDYCDNFFAVKSYFNFDTCVLDDEKEADLVMQNQYEIMQHADYQLLRDYEVPAFRHKKKQKEEKR